jgi:hypothetical protein
MVPFCLVLVVVAIVLSIIVGVLMEAYGLVATAVIFGLVLVGLTLLGAVALWIVIEVFGVGTWSWMNAFYIGLLLTMISGGLTLNWGNN